MTTSDLLAELDSLPEALVGLRAARVGEDLDRELTTASQLSATGRRIVALAASYQCDSIRGASGLGERLAGVAVAFASNGLSIFDPARASTRVMVLDGLLVSGTNLGRAAQQVRGTGATYVLAAALMSANRDPSGAVPAAD